MNKIFLYKKLKNIFDSFYYTLLKWRFRNKTHIQYYAAVMKYRAKRDFKTAVGGRWDIVGMSQFHSLLNHGLLPCHSFLEIGCGSLRGGLHTIKYLDIGNYTGNDISKEILDAAQMVLKENNLENKQPFLYVTDTLDFKEVIGKKFDYINARSVLTHMPPEDINELFKNVSRIMHVDSKFLATFFLAKGDFIYRTRHNQNFFYPFLWMRQTGEKYGLDVSLANETMNNKQKLLVIKLRA